MLSISHSTLYNVPCTLYWGVVRRDPAALRFVITSSAIREPVQLLCGENNLINGWNSEYGGPLMKHLAALFLYSRDDQISKPV